MTKYDPQFAPLPNGMMVDKEFVPQRIQRPHSAQDIFAKLGEGIDQNDDDYCTEDIKEAMHELFPRLKSH
jgi:hypothetical protein